MPLSKQSPLSQECAVRAPSFLSKRSTAVRVPSCVLKHSAARSTCPITRRSIEAIIMSSEKIIYQLKISTIIITIMSSLCMHLLMCLNTTCTIITGRIYWRMKSLIQEEIVLFINSTTILLQQWCSVLLAMQASCMEMSSLTSALFIN